jgi:probable rRNA maturation factor
MTRTGHSSLRHTPAISVHNRQRPERIETEKLQRFAERALALCLEVRPRKQSNLGSLPKIYVILISDRRMRELHRRFFEVNGPTDVITFQHGEIFVSVPTARRQAHDFRTSLLRELQLYIAHGLLHLHGFSDKTAAAARLMNATQKQIVRAALK